MAKHKPKAIRPPRPSRIAAAEGADSEEPIHYVHWVARTRNDGIVTEGEKHPDESLDKLVQCFEELLRKYRRDINLKRLWAYCLHSSNGGDERIKDLYERLSRIRDAHNQALLEEPGLPTSEATRRMQKPIEGFLEPSSPDLLGHWGFVCLYLRRLNDATLP
jgi:hypothetical protein